MNLITANKNNFRGINTVDLSFIPLDDAPIYLADKIIMPDGTIIELVQVGSTVGGGPTLTDRIYFVDSSPVFVNSVESELRLQFKYTSVSGQSPVVGFTNLSTSNAGIKSASIERVGSDSFVVLQLNTDITEDASGMVYLRLGNIGTTMNVQQVFVRKEFYLDKDSIVFSDKPSTMYINYTITGDFFGDQIEITQKDPSASLKIVDEYYVEPQNSRIVIKCKQNLDNYAKEEYLVASLGDISYDIHIMQTKYQSEGGDTPDLGYSISKVHHVGYVGDSFDTIAFTYTPRTGRVTLVNTPVSSVINTAQVYSSDGDGQVQLALRSSANITNDEEIAFTLRVADVSLGGHMVSYDDVTYTIRARDNAVQDTSTLEFYYDGTEKDKNYVEFNSYGFATVTVTSATGFLRTSDFAVTFKTEGRDTIYYIHVKKIGKNLSANDRESIVTVNFSYGVSKTKQFTFKVIQDKLPNVYEFPSWSDINIQIPEGNQYYRLVDFDNDKIYYTGRINSDINSIVNISDILRDNLNINYDIFANLYTTNKMLMTKLQYSDSLSNWNDSKIIRIYNNNSYEAYDGRYLDAQVIKYVDARQYIPLTFQTYDSLNYTATVTKRDMSTLQPPRVYSFPVSNEQKTICIPAGTSTTIVNDGNKVLFTIPEPCITKSRYCLYYMNLYGGWSWMLFNGKQLKTDSNTRSFISKLVDNNYSKLFSKLPYKNQIQESWSLTTDYLTDEQSDLMSHLYRSNLVYLHDLETDQIIAVTVDTKNFDYKTYNNNGRKMFTHTIVVNNSQVKNNF